LPPSLEPAVDVPSDDGIGNFHTLIQQRSRIALPAGSDARSLCNFACAWDGDVPMSGYQEGTMKKASRSMIIAFGLTALLALGGCGKSNTGGSAAGNGTGTSAGGSSGGSTSGTVGSDNGSGKLGSGSGTGSTPSSGSPSH
jgi:hypothetical protein